MKSAAPLPPSSLKNDLNENISSLINNQNIVFSSDALVYVLKEKTWFPVAESFSKICLLQTEPSTFKVVVLDVQHMVLQSAVDAFVNVKIKDTFVKWKSEKTTIGVRFTNKNTACSFYQHIENIVGIINEKKSFYLNVTLPSGKVQQVKVFLGMKLSSILKNICLSADLDPDKYRLVDSKGAIIAKLGCITEEFSNKSFKIVNVKDSLKKQNSIGSQNSSSSVSDDYPGEFYINLEDSNWIGFFNIANILKSELQNSSIQNLILSFVKERGGYSYLRKVNDHKMTHEIIDDLNDLAGQVHAINDRSELYRFVPNTVGSSSIDDGKKTSKRPAPPPPESKDLVKSEKISESNFSNKTIDTASQNSSSPKLLNKSKRHAPSVPSSPVVSVQSICSNKIVEPAKSSENFVKSIPSSPVPPIRTINSNKNMEPAKINEAVVKSILPSPVPATRFINSKKSLESTKDTVVKDTVDKDTVVKDTVVKDTVVKDTVVKSLSPVAPIRSINFDKNIQLQKIPETLVKSPITTQSQRFVKKSSEGDKPPPLFVPPPPPQEPPPDDYSSPEDETPLLNSSTLNQVETCNACIGSNDDHNVECILNSDANDTEKDVSAISDEIYDLIPAQSNTQNNPDISFESEILSEIAEVSEQSDGDDDITCDRTVDHICCESKSDFKLVSSLSNTHQQNVESQDLFVISKREKEYRKDDSSGSVLENSGSNRKEDSSENVLKNPGKNTENVMCAIEFPKSIEKIKNSSSKIPPSGLYSMLKRKSVGISDVNQSISLDNVDDDIDKLSTLNGKADSSSECDLERMKFLDSVRLNDKQASHINNQVSRINDHVKPIDLNNVEFNEECIKPAEILELKKNNIEKLDWEDKNKIIPQYTNHHDSSHHNSINCTIDCEKNLHENLSQCSNIMSRNPLSPDLGESTVFLKTTNQTPMNLNTDDKVSDLAPGSIFQIESEINEKLESLVYDHNNMESGKVINHLENKIHFLNPDLYSEIDASSSTQNYNLESCNKSENLIIDNKIQSNICNKLQHNNHVQPLQEIHKEQKSKVNSLYNPDSLVIFPDEQNEKKINLNTEKNYFDPDRVIIFPDQIPKDSEISKDLEPPNGANPWRIHALSHKSAFSKISPLSRDSSISKSSEVINTDALRLVGADVMALDEGESVLDKGNDLKKSIHFEKELTSETKSKSTDNFLSNQKSSFFYNKSLSQDGDSLLSALPKFEENTSSFPSYTNNQQLLNDFPSKKRQTEPLKNQVSLTKDYKLSIKNQTFDLRSKDQEVVQKKVPPKTLPKRKISNDKPLELRQTSNDINVRPSEFVQISNESNVRPSELARISQLLSSKN